MQTAFHDIDRELEQAFLKDLRIRPHHAWILKGSKSRRKLLFAKKIAWHILKQREEDSATRHQIDQHAHPNVFFVQRELDATRILLEQIRNIVQFIQHTSFDGQWKIVIIDSLNDLSLQCAHALLKILESPPPCSLFFLVHHHGDRILPTLSSRCAHLVFSPVSTHHLKELIPQHVPLSEHDLILSLAQGCPERLKDIVNTGVLEIYTPFLETIASKIPETLHTFVQSVIKDPMKMDIFFCILQWWIACVIKDVMLQGHYRGKPRISCSLSSLLDIQKAISKMINDGRSLDLEKESLVLCLFFELSRLSAF